MKNVIIIALYLSASASFRILSQITLATDTGSYWKLDETSGNIKDDTDSNPGTLHGATANPTSKIKNICSIEDTNDHSTIPHSEELNTQTILVTNMSVTPKHSSVCVGGTLQLRAIVSPANATNQSITWRNMSNFAWFPITTNGLVTGISVLPQRCSAKLLSR